MHWADRSSTERTVWSIPKQQPEASVWHSWADSDCLPTKRHAEILYAMPHVHSTEQNAREKLVNNNKPDNGDQIDGETTELSARTIHVTRRTLHALLK